jgi:hypothetical protein
MSKAAASTSSHKSSFSAAALVRSRNTLTFRLHPKQLIAFRSKATEILYRGAAGGGKPHLMRAAAISGCSVIAGLQVLSLSPYQQRSRLRDLPQFVALPEA